MRKLWAIQATVNSPRFDENGDRNLWTSTKQVPTFYLDPSVQGIVDEPHARKIARDIIGGYAGTPMDECHTVAVLVDVE